MTRQQHDTTTTPDNPPPPPPQYAPQEAGPLGAPPPYSQQGPPLPVRRESHPPTPPQRQSTPTPPASDVGRQQPVNTSNVQPAASSSSISAQQPASSRERKSFLLAGLARMSLSPMRPVPSSPSPHDKPLPAVPLPPPPVPPPSSRHRPTSYAGPPADSQPRPNHSRSQSSQIPPHAAPPVPLRPSGPPAFAPPPIAIHANLAGPSRPSTNATASPNAHTGGSWSVGQAVPNGRHAPNPFVNHPPMPRHNQPKPNTRSEPGGRRKPHPAIAAFPGPPPPRHPIARGITPPPLPPRKPTTPISTPSRHPVASPNVASTSSTHALPSATSSPPKQKPKMVAKAPSGVPISAPLYAAASKTKDKGKGKSTTPSPEPTVPTVNGFIIVDNSPLRPRVNGTSPPRAQKQNLPQPRTPSQNQAPGPSTATSDSARCAGFTRAGTPCKRQVKARAPFLLQRDMNANEDDDAPRAIGRYCRDHAGLVCAADGFYWRNSKGQSGVWIKFADFIPSDLGQQTRTLLRMTMESPVSAKDAPGHLYAYELRSLSTAQTAYVKVGRTDNVPRRLGQWSNQCTSHAPTLRDVFPLKTLNRQPSRLGSLLPGATKSSDAGRMVPFAKRWERLVHLELAERAASARGTEYGRLLAQCTDCGAVHKEIFPLAEPGAYDAVVQAVERWEKFVRVISE